MDGAQRGKEDLDKEVPSTAEVVAWGRAATRSTNSIQDTVIPLQQQQWGQASAHMLS